MNFIHINFLTAAVFFSVLCPVYAQGNEISSEKNIKLSFSSYIETIGKSLPEIKSNDMDVLAAENNIKQSKAAGDIALKGSGRYASTRMQTLSAPSMAKYKDDETDISVGASKRITSTGTDISTSFDYAKDVYTVSSLSMSSYVPSASVKITQPLLYNFLGKVDRYAEKNAEMKAEIAKIQRLENNKSVLNSYKKLYFQWLVNIKILDDIKASITNSELQRDQIAKNLKAGISEDDDFQRASASVLSYKRQYQDYLTSLKNIEHILSLYIDSQKTVPDEKDFTSYVSVAGDSSYNYVDFNNTQSSKVIVLTIKNLNYSQGVYENKLLPTLNVYAGVTQKNLATSSSESTRGLPDRDYQAGFEFSYKLGNNDAESNLEGIRIQRQSLKHEYDITLNTYKKSLLKLQESASGTNDQIKTIDDILKALHLQIRTEKKKYAQGRLDLSYIINTQNSISSYNISMLNLKYQLISNYLDYMDTIK